MPQPEEQNDPVWELLKQARQSDASPFFARNVAREIRKRESERGWLDAAAEWLASMRRPLILGGLAAALAVALVVLSVDGEKTPGEVVAEAPTLAEPTGPALADVDFDPTSEVGNLEYLGQLMAVSDPAALDDAALADLLF